MRLHITNFYQTVKLCKTNWNILSANESLKKKIQDEPITTFKCNKNLKELVGSNKIGNIVKRIKSTTKPRKSFLCFGNSKTLCCNQVITTLTFKSQKTKKTYKIFYKANCSSAYIMGT